MERASSLTWMFSRFIAFDKGSFEIKDGFQQLQYGGESLGPPRRSIGASQDDVR
jgi:hypothetical protein